MKLPERVLLACVALLVLAFDVWTVRSSGDPWRFGKKQKDYYNLLIDGWLDGQLAMKVDVPDALLKLSDPYDPQQRPGGLGLHDASFYHGKYYLYFGAAPVVTLMLPFRLITRIDLPQAVAVIVFVYGGFLASAAVWLRIRRKYFPESGAGTSAWCVLALGFASLGPVLLRRPHLWELPIGAAYGFAMLTLLASFESLHATTAWRRAGWFAGAGLFLGLAVASRPTYLAGVPLMLAPVIWWWREEKRVPWHVAWCGVLPLAAIGGLLALHNFLRFGNPLEFGQSYQFSLDYEAKMPHFRAGYAGFNAWRYFFSAAQWSSYFPFIAPAALPPKPAGAGGHDDVYGVLANMPFAWFALAAPLAAWRRSAGERGRLLAWLGAAVVLFAGLAAMLLCFFGSLARYQLDFTPALMLLAAVGVLALERGVHGGWTAARAWVHVLWSGTAIVSVIFAALFSWQLNRLFADRNPAGYRATARIVNRVPAWIESLTGAQPAARELEFWLPRSAEPRTATLLSVGDPPEVDRVFVRTINAGSVQLGFARAAMPEVVSAPLPFNFLQAHHVRVTLGAMLPPDTHPWFAGAPDEQARLASRLVRIELDGKIVVQAYRRFESTSGGRVRVGPKSLGDAEHPRFEGEFLGERRVPVKLAELGVLPSAKSLVGADGAIRLAVRFPRERGAASEPLVVTGGTGRGDLLGVEYLDGERVRFVFDHWGSALLRSEPVRIDDQTHEVVVKLPWLAAPPGGRVEQRGELEVVIDGAVVWRQTTMGYLADPEEIAVGENPIGGSNVGAKFRGDVRTRE
jgi:hypothetical protein